MADEDFGLEEANGVAQKYFTDRYRRLDKLQSYVKGTQYAGKSDWWDDCPIWEKAPCIVYPVAELAIDSNKELVLGDLRFPAITSRPEQSEQDEGLDEASSIALDKTINRIAKQVKFRAHCRKAFGSAQGACNAVTIFGVLRGRLFANLQSPKRCSAKFDDDGNVARLEIKYPFLRRDEHNRWKCYLYRRVIDTTVDIVFQEAPAERDGSEPTWTQKSAVKHGLGFCPVIWYRNDENEDDDITQIDGHAIHEVLTDEIDALNYSLSQRHRAILYCGDPQLVEIGVDPQFNPTEDASEGMVEMTPKGGLATGPEGANPVIGKYVRARTVKRGGGKRKKGPGYPWQYPQGVEVKYLLLPSDSVKAIFDHCEDLYSKLCDSMAVVIPGPALGKLLQVITGKGIEALRAKQLDRCDGYRDDFGEGYILRAMDMLLRIVYTVAKTNPKALPRLVGLEKGIKVLAQSAFIEGEWFGPRLTLKWGEYFRPDADDEVKTVGVATASQNLTTLRSKVQKVAKAFKIDDVDKYLLELEKENADREAKEAERMHALSKTLVPNKKPPNVGKQAPPRGEANQQQAKAAGGRAVPPAQGTSGKGGKERE
jgi:hypothetical protein